MIHAHLFSAYARFWAKKFTYRQLFFNLTSLNLAMVILTMAGLGGT